MTMAEKITMVHGSGGPYVGNVAAIPRLGIPAIKLNDGPQGFRDDAHPGTTTQWPSCLTVAASFNPKNFYTWGVAMGAEFAGKGANVQLGPGVCIARVPVNGRNFEYLSGEDPLLGYENAYQLVQGIQSQGVIANAKHYIHNNQETDRTSVSANVDERTRMEIYIRAFAGAVDGGVLSIMCSYNRINSTYACENDETLTKCLKTYTGFSGWVMSDWGGTHSTVNAANNGLDQQMPDASFFGSALQNAVNSGAVPQARLDDMVLRILTALYAIGEFDHPVSGNIDADVTSSAHNTLTRQLAAESIVLLKNSNNLLPLSKTDLKSVAVFNGPASSNVITGGGGSGSVQPKYQVSALAGISNVLNGGNRGQCTFDDPNYDYYQPGNPAAPATSAQDCCNQCRARGDCNAWTYYENECYFKTNNSGRIYSQGRQSGTVPAGNVTIKYYNGNDPQTAASMAAAADVAICVLATSSSEGSDRPNLSLPSEQINICNAVANAQKTIAIVINPGAVLTDWDNKVDALLACFMPGQEEGNAIADVLFGDVNPSAKLPVTFPNKENEVGFLPDEYPGVNLQTYYREALNVGYRWYATHAVKPKYAFGFGLSYTTFSLTNLGVSGRTVSATLMNTGKVAGAEVVQLYLGYPESAGEPPINLRGFQKVMLNSGASQSVSFTLTDEDLSIWDETTHSHAKQSGTFTVYVGTSSQDLPLKQTVNF
jgi:beta-glucosidase